MRNKHARISLAIIIATLAGFSAHATTATPTTLLISKATSGAANGDSGATAVSADGRYVAFDSAASNLVPGDTNGISDVFVADRRAGTIERVSVSSTGAQSTVASSPTGGPNGNGSLAPSISADGRYVAFVSDAVNLATTGAGSTTNAYVRDRVAGTTALVSRKSNGQPMTNGDVLGIALSADGSTLAFTSNSPDLVPGDTNAMSDVFVRDLVQGTTSRVSLGASAAQGTGISDTPAISADGRYVAFRSTSTTFWPNDTNGSVDVFRRDRQANSTMLASYTSARKYSAGDTVGPNETPHVNISGDGAVVAYDWSGSDIVSGDTNNVRDVFVRNLSTGSIARASLDETGGQFTLGSQLGSISSDASHVAFVTGNAMVSAAGTNTIKDVFVRDLAAAKTARVSLTASGARSNADSVCPALTADGSQAGFASKGALTPDIDPKSTVFNTFVRGVPLAPLPSVPAITTPVRDAVQRASLTHVTGTARPGNTVTLYDNAAVLSGETIVAASNGTWDTYRTFDAGAHSLTAKASDDTGAASAVSAARTFSVDLSPVVPVIVTPADGSTVPSATNVTGTSAPAAKLTLSEGGVDLAHVVADESGSWALGISSLTEGTHTITATSVDSQNQTTTSAERVFSVDATPPAVPTIDTGAPAPGSYIKSSKVTVQGTGEPGSRVSIFEGTLNRGSGIVSSTGSWSVQANLLTGAHSITAKATDSAGNASAASATRSFTVDTIAPQVSFTTADHSVFTPAAPVAIAGQYVDYIMGSRVSLTFTDASGAVVDTVDATCGCAVAGARVHWTDAPTLDPGYYTVTATGYDAAGNQKATSITIIVL